MGQAATRLLGAGARAAPLRAMDGRAPRARDAPAASTLPGSATGRKPKAKAPLPPAETKSVDISSVDSVESSTFIMEQKENMIDKDIEISVVLPGDIIKSTTVHGSKPMMDLLIFLCAQYHLNPSSYTIDLLSTENNPIKFKPNTPIGMLEVEKVVLKPKSLDKKKPIPLIPEKTVRVVINFKKTQKTIVRVNPHASLQELVPIICSKCEFDALHTVLLKDYHSQEPLDMTKSLNDLGLRELYAMDVGKATSAFNKSSSQESCQTSQNLDIIKEKENKGFFGLFQRSKKKREQTASAPATPLVSKHRPTFTRSNTISKPYISNTLPSDAPKKRRAPLPPMSGSQSAPQDLAHIQERPTPCVVKSMSLDDSDKSPCEADTVKTGSLQLSNTSFGNSSLKRTKRKAPSPPSKMPLLQSDESSQVTDSVSEASSPEGLSSPAGISSDYSLEEIDEKEELSEVPKDEAENTSLKSQIIPFGSPDKISTLKNDPDSALGNDTGESSQNSNEEKQETRNTDGQGPHIMEHNTNTDEKVADRVKSLKSSPVPNQVNDQNEAIVIPANTDDMKNGMRTEINVGGVAKNNNVDVEVDRLSNYQAQTAKSYKEDHLVASSVAHQKVNQCNTEKVKILQDVSIQTTPSCNNFDGNQGHTLPDFKVDEGVQVSSNNKSTRPSSLSSQSSVDISGGLRNQGALIENSGQFTIKDPVCAHGNNVLSTVDGTDKNSTAYTTNHPLYQDYNPKPKPSNEITREYIPKIGMTTYKIVPPKSLEILKDCETESIGYKHDQETHTLEKKYTNGNMKETSMQTEDSLPSASLMESPADLKLRPIQTTEYQVPSMESSPKGTVVNTMKPVPRMTRDNGTAPFAPKLEEINSILESKIKARGSNPQTKPSSFFLQMQKRASGHYVTSAAAKSVHTAPLPSPKELTKAEECERDTLPSPEKSLPPLTQSFPQSHIKNSKDNISNQKSAGNSPPPVAPKPVSLPSNPVTALNLKTLKTFGAPRPYSSSSPSPFALAVVKRSQSFSKGSTVPSTGTASAQAPSDTDQGKTPSVNKCVDTPQLDTSDKENNSAHSEQNSQKLSSADCPPLTLQRQSSLTFQSSDPEQIRQSLLTAIRSGEAAAKLKRVTIPSNTVSVNGRPRLTHTTIPDTQDAN